MKIWVVERTDHVGYDEYDSLVVIAKDEEQAKCISPNGCLGNVHWCEGLKAECVGRALKDAEPDIILASFNAG